jgi:FkbM family methyltransferase
MKALIRKIYQELWLFNELSGENSLTVLIKCWLHRSVKSKKILELNYKNNRIFIRSYNKDLETIVYNIKNEFDCLSEFYEKDSFNGIILDAGGYIGGAAIALSRMYPSAKIISIEPSIDNYKILLKNIKNIKNIKAVNAALIPNSTENNTVNLSKRQGHTEVGFTIMKNSSNSKLMSMNEVETIKIKDIEADLKDKVSMVKMDIEGAESLFFSEENWSSLQHVDIIFCELHERIIPGIEESFRRNNNRFVIPTDGEKFLSILKVIV